MRTILWLVTKPCRKDRHQDCDGLWRIVEPRVSRGDYRLGLRVLLPPSADGAQVPDRCRFGQSSQHSWQLKVISCTLSDQCSSLSSNPLHAAIILPLALVLAALRG